MSEDLLLQYPNGTDEMLVPAQKAITVIDRVLKKKLMFLTVSIPENGILEVFNNNMLKLFFSGESGTIQFYDGLYFENAVIKITNAGTTPARFNYRMIFAD